VGILLYLWLGVTVLQGERPLWWAATALAITNALHPSTVILAPSLLYLGWCQWRTRRTTWPTVILQIALPIGIVALATIGLMESGGHGLAALLTNDRPGGSDARPFVPLWQTATRWEQYTMFSWPHLRDVLNEQLLVAPIVWPSLVWVLVTRDWRLEPSRATSNLQSLVSNFLALASLSYLLFIWVWNPDYGGQRDWDLFSLAALPATLWLIWLLPRRFTNARALLVGILPLLVFQAAKSAAWIYQNTLPWEWPQ